VSETIGARAATAVEARILKETRGAPLLTMERTAYDKHGRGVEHALHVYRASLCTFEVTRTDLVFRGYAAESRWLSRTSGNRSQMAWSG
jgi:hypothetical protein